MAVIVMMAHAANYRVQAFKKSRLIQFKMITVFGAFFLTMMISGMVNAQGASSFGSTPSSGALRQAEGNNPGADSKRQAGNPDHGFSLRETIRTIGAAKTILRLPGGTHIVDADLTIPANITLKVEPGTIIDVATVKTLTINGGLEAGLYQIFSCTGTGRVVFAQDPVLVAYPQWWGAVGDGRTNDLTAIRAAVNSKAKVVTFPDTGSPYIVNAETNLASNQEIRFLNQATIRTTFDAIPIMPIFNLHGDVHDITIRGGILEGTNTTGLGSSLDPTRMRGLLNYTGGNNPYNITVEGVEVRYSRDAGIVIVGLTSTGIKILKCKVHHNAAYGISAPSGDMVIQECDIHDNQYAGIDAGGPWGYGSLKILDNRIYRNGGVNGGGTQDYGSWAGILLNGTRRALVKGNQVYSNGVEGIRVDVPWVSYLPQDIGIEGNIIYGHLTTINPYWTPAGIRITGGKNIKVLDNDCHNNYDNFIFQVRDAADGYVGLENVTVKGNISTKATRYGYWASRPGSLRGGKDIPIGAVIRGLLLQGNASEGDATPYQCDTFGVFWDKDKVTIPKKETLGAELVANGGFETSDPPGSWVTQNGATLAQVMDHRPGSPGTHSLNVKTGTPGSCGVSDIVALAAGKLYKLDIWVKRVTDADTRPRAMVAVSGGGAGQVLSWWDNPAELPVNTWKQHEAYFLASSTGKYEIVLYGGVTAGDQFRFDDVSLKEVTSVDAVDNIH